MGAASPPLPVASAVAATAAAATPEAQAATPEAQARPTAREALVLSRVQTSEPLVALTFDCCQTAKPAGYDAKIVAFLVAHHVPATFTLGGRWMEAHPEPTRYLASIPYFELGDHSYLHPHMRRLTPAQQDRELSATQQICHRLTGRWAEAFRPPYGEWDPGLAAAAGRAGMYTVLWTISTGDPDKHATVKDLQDEARKAKPGAIVLMHANGRGWKTAEALPGILAIMQKKGLRPVTLHELLAAGKGVAPT